MSERGQLATRRSRSGIVRVRIIPDRRDLELRAKDPQEVN